jgi:hypothetical protein
MTMTVVKIAKAKIVMTRVGLGRCGLLLERHGAIGLRQRWLS